MEQAAIYLLKSAALIGAFYLGYQLLLRNETFFRTNRWYLIGGLVTAAILPAITFEKVVFVARESAPVYDLAVEVPVTAVAPPAEIDYLTIVFLFYFIGFAVFALKFVADCFSVYRLLRGRESANDSGLKLIDVSENIAPFSFFNFIVYNSASYSPAELQNIIAHEKVHCNEKHSADVLIAQLFCIVFWWNPLVWLHKKAILQNLEFIADSEATKTISDVKSYQFTLLKITTQQNCVAITNHFYQSLIKKRIIMLNKNQSKKWNALRYLLMAPVLVLFMFHFQTQVVAQELPNEAIQKATTAESNDKWIIDKNTTDNDLDKIETEIAQRYGISQKFTDVKRNASREITSFTSKTQYQNGKTSKWKHGSSDPIGNIVVSMISETDGEAKLHIEMHDVVMKIDQNNSTSKILKDKTASKDKEEKDQNLTTVSKIYPYDKNYLMIVNGKEYFSKDMEDRTISLEGTIIQLNEADAVAKYGERARDGAFIFNGPALIRMKSDGTEAQENSGLSPEQAQKIRREVKKAEDDIKKAQPEIARARAEVERTRLEIERTKPEIERVRAKIEREREWNPVAKSATETAQLERELEQSKRELEQSKRELEQSQRQLENAKKEIQKSEN